MSNAWPVPAALSPRTPASLRPSHGRIQHGLFRHVFVPQVDDAVLGPHGEPGEDHAFDHQVRQFVEDHPVFEGPRFALVRIADHVLRPPRLTGHHFPFAARGKPGPAHPPQHAVLEFLQSMGRRGRRFGQGADGGVVFGRVVVRIAPETATHLGQRVGQSGGVAVDDPCHAIDLGERKRGQGHIVDGDGGGRVAAAQAGHLVDLHVVAPGQACGQLGLLGGTTRHGTDHVAAHLHRCGRRRSAAEVRVVTDQLFQPIQGHVVPLGNLAQHRVVQEPPVVMPREQLA